MTAPAGPAVDDPFASSPYGAGANAGSQHVLFLLAFDGPAEFDPFELAVSPRPVVLRPGETRKVFLTAVVLDEADVESVLMRADGSVFLAIRSGRNEVAPPSNPRREVALATIERLCEEFEIRIPRTAHGGPITFSLYYAAGSKSRGRVVKVLTAEVEGEEARPWQPVRDALGIGLADRPPTGTAFVHVQPEGDDRLRMSLYFRPGAEEPELVFPLPGIDLDRWVRAQEPPQNIRNLLRTVSQAGLPKEFARAVTDFLQGAGGPSSPGVLVVCDHANSDIPWELMEVDDDCYLGAEAELVRWVPVRFYADECPLILDESTQAGTIVAFRNGPAVGVPDADEMVLRDQLACVPHDAWDDLARQLTPTLPHTGLVYFYCHGTYDFEKLENLYLRPETLSNADLPIVAFQDIPRQTGPRPVFFINACHSARLIRQGSDLFGLATILLARAAAGFIGTLARVRADLGVQIAAEILSRLRAAPGAEAPRPSAVLRALRADAAARIRAGTRPTQDEWTWFLFAFLYVYYGRPFLRLDLRSCLTPTRQTTPPGRVES
jgi:hypothetical protein